MDEADLQVFIDGTVHYFKQTTNKSATVATPYLVENRSSLTKEYSGIIGISGKRKGSVYFTCDSNMLDELLRNMGETLLDHSTRCDLVGEIANTISGNARKEFGKDFMISVPVVIYGEPQQVIVPKDLRSYVIPIEWSVDESYLVISLE